MLLCFCMQYFCQLEINPEDGDCNVCQKTETALTYDMAICHLPMLENTYVDLNVFFCTSFLKNDAL